MTAIPNAKSRVLVVDDDRALADTLLSILKRRGFDVNAAYNGQEAIRYALISPPDFVIMDVVLDEIDGVDAAIAIREACPHCRILLISGEPDALKRLTKSYSRGHNFELLMKPVETALLLAWLRDEWGSPLIAA